MVILIKKKNNKDIDAHQIVAIFGLGLIGSSICEYLMNQGCFYKKEMFFFWENPQLRVNQLESIVCEIERFINEKVKKNNIKKILFDIIWGAGKCGFSAKESDTELEYDCFTETIKKMANLKLSGGELKTNLHLISSAGGIFEGSSQDKVELKPNPLRPYGYLKLRQEHYILQLPDNVQKFIYRLSSVYGAVNPNQRMGLIPTLIFNGLSHRVSTIVGDIETVRDYISREDIARFIGDKVINPTMGIKTTYLLASGKPSSIYEVKKTIEDVIRKKIYINFHRHRTNKQNICFKKSQIPDDLNPQLLNTGVRRVYYDWIHDTSYHF